MNVGQQDNGKLKSAKALNNQCLNLLSLSIFIFVMVNKEW